jgi:4-amino-4-deoxy-L-arabinose transferase-like glycosyltransferase
MTNPPSTSPTGQALAYCSRHPMLWLMLLAVLTLGWSLGQNWRWASREIRHAEIMREMVQDGVWLPPHRLGEVYPDKPPVMHVVGAGLMWLTGQRTMLMARLPSVLAALLALLATWRVACLLAGPGLAWLAPLLLLSYPTFINFARQARPDITLTALIMVACWALVAALHGPPRWRRMRLLLGGLAAGLAILTKGPYGLMLPLGFGLALRYRQDDQLQKPVAGDFAWLTLGAMVALWAGLGLCWSVDDGAYLSQVIFQPDLTEGAAKHSRIFFYYAGPLLAATAPAGLAIFAPQLWWRARRPLPLAMCFLGIMLLLSLVPGKRIHYLLIAMPFLALATQDWLQHAAAERWRRWLPRVALIAILCSWGYYAFYIPLSPRQGDPEWLFAQRILQIVQPDQAIVTVNVMSEALAFVGDNHHRVQEAGSWRATRVALRQAHDQAALVLQASDLKNWQERLAPLGYSEKDRQVASSDEIWVLLMPPPASP